MPNAYPEDDNIKCETCGEMICPYSYDGESSAWEWVHISNGDPRCFKPIIKGWNRP